MDVAIRAAAGRFRAAFDRGGLSHNTFRRFPRGSCGDACELLGEYLRESSLGDWLFCSGLSQTPTGQMSTHAWLERHDLIVDITADQFGTGQSKVLVTRDRSWHDSSFSPMGGAHRAGLDYYTSGPEGAPLRADYRILKARADALVA